MLAPSIRLINGPVIIWDKGF